MNKSAAFVPPSRFGTQPRRVETRCLIRVYVFVRRWRRRFVPDARWRAVWAFYLFAVAAGAFSTALSGSNATLSKQLAQPITAGLIVQGVTIAALVVTGLFYGGMAWPGATRVAALPWWAWLGGLGGATILLAQLMVAQRIGAAPYTAVTVSAGIVVSVLLDHFGWLGFDRNPAQWGRVAGAVLMVGGVVLVTRN